MPFTDEIAISNPVTNTMTPITILVRYSILPYPKGCLRSGCRCDSLVPTMVIIEEEESAILFTASLIMAMEFDNMPTKIFTPANNKLVTIPIIDTLILSVFLLIVPFLNFIIKQKC